MSHGQYQTLHVEVEDSVVLWSNVMSKMIPCLWCYGRWVSVFSWIMIYFLLFCCFQMSTMGMQSSDWSGLSNFRLLHNIYWLFCFTFWTIAIKRSISNSTQLECHSYAIQRSKSAQVVSAQRKLSLRHSTAVVKQRKKADDAQTFEFIMAAGTSVVSACVADDKIKLSINYRQINDTSVNWRLRRQLQLSLFLFMYVIQTLLWIFGEYILSVGTVLISWLLCSNWRF